MNLKKKILLFTLGIILGVIPTIPFLYLNHRNSPYVGNLNKYEKLDIDFQEEFNDNCYFNDRVLQIDGHAVAEIDINNDWATEKATNYNVENIILISTNK